MVLKLSNRKHLKLASKEESEVLKLSDGERRGRAAATLVNAFAVCDAAAGNDAGADFTDLS